MSERKTYGGFFPLDLPQSHPVENTVISHLAEGCAFYNGRSAISELIRVNGITDVLMPGYICPVVYQAVETAGAAWRTYRIRPGFEIDYADLSSRAGQATLVIVPGYFGVYLPDPVALEYVMNLSGCRILLDYAQALYEPCPDCFAAVYSPRKFLGVPDGGMLVIGRRSRLKGTPPPTGNVDQAVFGDRMSCLGIRFEYPMGEILDRYRSLERDMPVGPYRMSNLARHIFTAFDHDAAIRARRANYEVLLETLHDCQPPAASAPMCFPLPVTSDSFDRLRRRLISAGIFVPHFWPDMPEAVDDLGKTVLALPIDNRYRTEDMITMGDLVKQISE